MPQLLVALALTLVVASCGEDPETPDQPPAQLLDEAFAQPPSSGEAVVDIELALEGQPLLSDPITADLEGPFE
ncbi:MAG: hypothetical protein M3M99_03685, partial [Actinomycetota bacterium]|nr:hypothetical protein [Actinomycetota bacterium]